MQTLFNNVRYGFVLALTAMLVSLTSCSEDSSVDNPEDSGLDITLTLNTGSGTRAIDESDVEGEGYENYIDINKLHIYFFTGNGDDNSATYLFEFEPETVTQSSTDESQYTIAGKIDYRPTGSFKIVVLANWDEAAVPTDLSEESTIDDITLRSGAFSYNYDGTTNYEPSESAPIPMYGVKTFDSFTFDNILRSDLGEINMIRSVAKIIVRSTLSEISDVTLTRCNNAGMSAPYQMYRNTLTSTSSHLNIPQENYSSYPAEAPSVIENLPFVKTADNEYTIYIPEYRNNGTSSLGEVVPTQINLVLDGQARVLEFKDYSDETSTLHNILRNHIYEYIVSASSINYVVTSMSELEAGPIIFD